MEVKVCGMVWEDCKVVGDWQDAMVVPMYAREGDGVRIVMK